MVNPGPELFLGAGLARWMDEVDRKLAAVSASASGPIVATTIRMVDGDGNPRQVIGAQPDGTYSVRDIAGPTPPMPEAPTAFPMPGGIRVVTTGKPAGVEFWPADVTRIDIHLSRDANFTVSDETRAGTVGTLKTGTGRQIDEGQWWVRLVAVSASGRPSAATIPVGVVALSAAGFDQLARDAADAAQARADDAYADAQASLTGDVDPSRLSTGRLDASVQIVIGDPNGARVTIDGAYGIAAIGADGSVKSTTPITGDPFFAGEIMGASLKSLDWIEDVAGTYLAPGGEATHERLRVLREITATTGEFSEIIMRGRPIEDVIDATAGMIVAAGKTSAIKLVGQTEEVGIADIAFEARQGRSYALSTIGGRYSSSDPNTRLEFRYRYTMDGSAPTPASPSISDSGHLDGGYRIPDNDQGTISQKVLSFTDPSWTPPMPPATTSVSVRALITMRRSTGSGTVEYNSTNGSSMKMGVTDLGPSAANSLSANYSLAPGSSAPPPPPPVVPPAAVQSYFERFYITWSQTYREDGMARTDKGSTMYQGKGPGGAAQYGNLRSLCGFDVNYVRQRIGGGRIKEARLEVRNISTYYNAGVTACIGLHNSAGPPASFPFGQVAERRAYVEISQGGTVSLEAKDAAEKIRDGISAGFAIGAAPDSSLGWYSAYYGAGGANVPYLDVVWEK